MHNSRKIHVRQGDTVKIISGKDKGKIGKISKVLKQTNQIIVQDINIKKKHIKPKKEGDIGRISQFEAPINSSNVMLYDLEKEIASRTCVQVDETGNKVRVLKKLLKQK
jgi:large subunit ribosomal protein L24